MQTGMLYFSVVVSTLYLVAGGWHKSIRAYFQKKFDDAVAAKASETTEK